MLPRDNLSRSPARQAPDENRCAILARRWWRCNENVFAQSSAIAGKVRLEATTVAELTVMLSEDVVRPDNP